MRPTGVVVLGIEFWQGLEIVAIPTSWAVHLHLANLTIGEHYESLVVLHCVSKFVAGDDDPLRPQSGVDATQESVFNITVNGGTRASLLIFRNSGFIPSLPETLLFLVVSWSIS